MKSHSHAGWRGSEAGLVETYVCVAEVLVNLGGDVLALLRNVSGQR